MHLGKSNIHKLRVLFDIGSSGSIIVAKFIKNLHIENDTKTEWLMKGGTFHTSGKCTTNFILNEFYASKVIEWILHVDKTFGPHRYDMIIGHDLMSQLRIILDASETGKCQSPTTMSHFATFLSSFCDTCLTVQHFFLLTKTRSQKSKTLLQICSM
jgi:hypothetical protein